jgi:RTX calcium-binding nonapeptide repeat (4 copies)
MYGDSGDDLIMGGNGDDFLAGDNGNTGDGQVDGVDRLFGGAGNDYLLCEYGGRAFIMAEPEPIISSCISGTIPPFPSISRLPGPRISCPMAQPSRCVKAEFSTAAAATTA